MGQNKTVVVFYGSQTGTAEEFSTRLSKDAQRYGLKALVVDPEGMCILLISFMDIKNYVLSLLFQTLIVPNIT